MKIIKGRKYVLAEDVTTSRGELIIKQSTVVEALADGCDADALVPVCPVSTDNRLRDTGYTRAKSLTPYVDPRDELTMTGMVLDTVLPAKKKCIGDCTACRGECVGSYPLQPLPDKIIVKDNKFYDAHYTDMAGLEPIEVMQLVMSHDEFIGFLKGNVIKYTMRAGHKQGEAAEKDIAKAKRYKQWLLKVMYLAPQIIINPKED